MFPILEIGRKKLFALSHFLISCEELFLLPLPCKDLHRAKGLYPQVVELSELVFRVLVVLWAIAKGLNSEWRSTWRNSICPFCFPNLVFMRGNRSYSFVQLLELIEKKAKPTCKTRNFFNLFSNKQKGGVLLFLWFVVLFSFLFKVLAQRGQETFQALKLLVCATFQLAH